MRPASGPVLHPGRFAGGADRGLWDRASGADVVCPHCGRSFANRNQSQPRFLRIQELSPHNVVHTFRLTSPADVDAEFVTWLAEAYRVGAQELR